MRLACGKNVMQYHHGLDSSCSCIIQEQLIAMSCSGCRLESIYLCLLRLFKDILVFLFYAGLLDVRLCVLVEGTSVRPV